MFRLLIPSLLALTACGQAPDTIVPVGFYGGVDNQSDARIIFARDDADDADDVDEPDDVDAPDDVDGPDDADDGDVPDEGEYGISCDEGGEVDAYVEDGVLIIDGERGGDCSIWLPGDVVEELVVRGDGHVAADEDATLTALARLDVRGTGDVSLSGVDVPALDIEAGGNGAIDIAALSADALYLSLSGNGDVVLAGEVDTADIDISGSGNLDASELVIGSLTIAVSGSGSADVNVTDSVASDVTGSGSVEVSGEASVEGNLGL